MIIGLTGSFGTGKTTVAKFFNKLGAKVIDADKIVHKFIDATTRKELAKIVFKRQVYLELICKIIHPLVIKKIKDEIKRLNPHNNIIIIDAPLLIETRLHKIADKLIVVKAKKETQIQRSMRRTGLTRNEILRRIKFQMPLREKAKLADFIIDNNGRLKQTETQVKAIWDKLKKRT